MRTKAYEIIHKVLRREGGFVNDTDDRGGPTKYGVTLDTLRNHSIDVNDDDCINIHDVQALTIEKAIDVYKKEYWDPARVEQMPDRFKDFYFDCCVHHGRSRAVKIIQHAVCAKGSDIVVDGIIGPQTLSHARLLTLKDAVYQRIYFYSVIIKKDSSQLRFRSGWYNRALEFLHQSSISKRRPIKNGKA